MDTASTTVPYRYYPGWGPATGDSTCDSTCEVTVASSTISTVWTYDVDNYAYLSPEWKRARNAEHARSQRLLWPEFTKIRKIVPAVVRCVTQYLRTGRRTRESRAQREVRQLAMPRAV